MINEIYEMNLYKLLNESAKGLTGARGRRHAEDRELQQKKIIAKALED